MNRPTIHVREVRDDNDSSLSYLERCALLLVVLFSFGGWTGLGIGAAIILAVEEMGAFAARVRARRNR